MPRRVFPLLIVIVSVGILAGTLYLSQRLKPGDTAQKPVSAFNNFVSCYGQVSILSSTDYTGPYTQQISINNRLPRYYIRVVDLATGQPCVGDFYPTFSVYDLDDGHQISSHVPTITEPPWGAGFAPSQYWSNAAGIARIDTDAYLPGNRYLLSLKLRPHVNFSAPDSNNITVIVGNDGDTGPRNLVTPASPIDISSYFITIPGYTYFYTNSNRLAGKTFGEAGTTMLHIEQPTTWCGIPVIPYRFTKDANWSYWAPIYNGSDASTNWWTSPNVWDNLFKGKEALRWLIANPNYPSIPSSIANWNNYLWVAGHKMYPYDGNIRDITPKYVNSPSLVQFYKSDSPTFPAYILGPKQLSLPYAQTAYSANHELHTGNPGVDGSAEGCPVTANSMLTSPLAQPTVYWKVRAEIETISIANGNPSDSNDGWDYSGPALRLDYFERPPDGQSLTAGSVKESWYFVKNVGLVMIKTKNFSDFDKNPLFTLCQEDSDCIADTTSLPTHEMKLARFYPNPLLSLAVSTDGTNFSDHISTTAAKGYWLKVTNPPNYTGYLEAENAGKWNWVENGLTQINLRSDFPNGSFPARFRTWIDNTTYPNETRTYSDTRPWSNTITIDITTPTPTPAPVAQNPSNLSATCLTPTQVRLTWTPGANVTRYLNRVADNDNNVDTIAEQGSCGGPVTDFCDDYTTTTSQTLNIASNTTYSWWIHGANDYNYQPTPASTTFSCAANTSTPTPTPTPTPAPNPTGNTDLISCTSIIGWSCDPNYSGSVAQITILANNVPFTTTNANVTRSDLSTVCAGTTNHGFSISTPSTFKDGVTRTIAVQANINGFVKSIGEGNLTCPGPSNTPTPTPSPSPTPTPSPKPTLTPVPSATPTPITPSTTASIPTTTLTPIPTINPVYDTNGNGVVDINDVVFIITKYLTATNSSDVNKDGVTNVWDMVTTLKIIGR